MTAPVPAALADQPIVVIDVEGNGQQPAEIIELAILPVQGLAEAHGDPARSWLIRPERPITSLVTRKVHGITNADVADCPTWTEVANDIETHLADRVLVAHNATVDYRVLTAQLPGWRPRLVLDTMRFARHVWPGLPGYGLDALLGHGGIDVSGPGERRRHRAGYDAWCTAQLLLALTRQTTLDWDDLVQVAALPTFANPAELEGGLW